MAPLSDIERRGFLEICDDRYQTRSTVLTSQLPVSSWHAQIGDPTIADSIMDRLVHNAHRIEHARRVHAKKPQPNPGTRRHYETTPHSETNEGGERDQRRDA